MERARILLVDDEVVFAENMTKLLRNRGYDVTPVNSGEVALEKIESEAYDVVVLDLRMPGLDGLATLREIKELDRNVQVLILTGHGAVDSALAAMKMEACDYLTKPCEVEELIEKIEGAWRKKDEADSIEMEDRIKRMVESPRSVLDMKPPRKKR